MDSTRQRVLQACSACRKSRRKCSGQAPCVNCAMRGEVCEYEAAKKRGPAPRQKMNTPVIIPSQIPPSGSDHRNMDYMYQYGNDFADVPTYSNEFYTNDMTMHPRIDHDQSSSGNVMSVFPRYDDYDGEQTENLDSTRYFRKRNRLGSFDRSSLNRTVPTTPNFYKSQRARVNNYSAENSAIPSSGVMLERGVSNYTNQGILEEPKLITHPSPAHGSVHPRTSSLDNYGVGVVGNGISAGPDSFFQDPKIMDVTLKREPSTARVTFESSSAPSSALRWSIDSQASSPSSKPLRSGSSSFVPVTSTPTSLSAGPKAVDGGVKVSADASVPEVFVSVDTQVSDAHRISHQTRIRLGVAERSCLYAFSSYSLMHFPMMDRESFVYTLREEIRAGRVLCPSWVLPETEQPECLRSAPGASLAEQEAEQVGHALCFRLSLLSLFSVGLAVSGQPEAARRIYLAAKALLPSCLVSPSPYLVSSLLLLTRFARGTGDEPASAAAFLGILQSVSALVSLPPRLGVSAQIVQLMWGVQAQPRVGALTASALQRTLCSLTPQKLREESDPVSRFAGLLWCFVQTTRMGRKDFPPEDLLWALDEMSEIDRSIRLYSLAPFRFIAIQIKLIVSVSNGIRFTEVPEICRMFDCLSAEETCRILVPLCISASRVILVLGELRRSMRSFDAERMALLAEDLIPVSRDKPNVRLHRKDVMEVMRVWPHVCRYLRAVEASSVSLTQSEIRPVSDSNSSVPVRASATTRPSLGLDCGCTDISLCSLHFQQLHQPTAVTSLRKRFEAVASEMDGLSDSSRSETLCSSPTAPVSATEVKESRSATSKVQDSQMHGLDDDDHDHVTALVMLSGIPRPTNATITSSSTSSNPETRYNSLPPSKNSGNIGGSDLTRASVDKEGEHADALATLRKLYGFTGQPLFSQTGEGLNRNRKPASKMTLFESLTAVVVPPLQIANKHPVAMFLRKQIEDDINVFVSTASAAINDVVVSYTEDPAFYAALSKMEQETFYEKERKPTSGSISSEKNSPRDISHMEANSSSTDEDLRTSSNLSDLGSVETRPILNVTDDVLVGSSFNDMKEEGISSKDLLASFRDSWTFSPTLDEFSFLDGFDNEGDFPVSSVFYTPSDVPLFDLAW